MRYSKSNFFVLIAFTFISSLSFSIEYDENQSVYSHLTEINKEWLNYESVAPIEFVEFDNDNDRISFHLNLVGQELRNKIPKSIQGEALQNRLRLLSDLEIYGQQKVFPTNHYHSERTPYFIDNYGVHCAVGYLIMKSGHSELSNRIKEEHNYDYIRDIKTPGIAEWAEEFGFELSELAWIQPTYPVMTAFTSLGSGTNNPVKKVCEDKTNNRLIYAGDFTEIDNGISCPGIGYYDIATGQMHCLGGGLDGIINDVVEFNGDIIVSGQLVDNGINYSQAIYSNGNWTYVNIPNREGLEAITSISNSTLYKREIVIRNDQGNDEYELWRYDNSNIWSLQATSYGVIKSMAIGETHQAFGGYFDSLFINSTNTMLYTKNAFLRENSSGNWSALTGQICSSVYVVKWLNNNFFFAGKGLYVPNPSRQIMLSMIHSDTLAGLYSESGFGSNMNLSTSYIYDIEAISSDELVVCGDNLTVGWMYHGTNLGIVNYSIFDQAVGDPSGNIGGAGLASMNGKVSSLARINSKLYIGGEFTSSFESTDLNHLAKLDAQLSTENLESVQFNVFPNPASDFITVHSNIELQSIIILDMNGRILIEKNENFDSINIQELRSGTYFIKVKTKSGQVSHRQIVKK